MGSRTACKAGLWGSDSVALTGGEAYPSGLRDIWRRGRHCDAQLLIGAEMFVAHRVVLASASEFFDDLFSAPPESGPVSISEIELPSCFSSVLTFIYDGRCHVSAGYLESMLSAACSLKLSSLRDAVVFAMTQRLSPQSCVRAWALAVQYSLQELACVARDKCLEFFEEISDTVDAHI